MSALIELISLIYRRVKDLEPHAASTHNFVLFVHTDESVAVIKLNVAPGCLIWSRCFINPHFSLDV